MSVRPAQADWSTLIGPAVYDANVFRLLHLPVNASEREIRRRLQAVQMALQLEAPIPSGPAPLLPVTVTGETLADIPLRLQNPEFRLLQELFWFWPGQDGQPGGDGWNCLQAGNQLGAAEAWTRGVFSRDMDPTCIHNLAVLRHWQALEGERRLVAGQAMEGSRQSLWRAALRHWRDLVTHEGLAAYLATRLTAIADPRLSHQTIDDLRRNLPAALGAVNATLAAVAAERGDTPSIEMHLNLLREAGLDSESIQMVFQPHCRQVSSVIKALCESAWEGDELAEAAHQLLERAEAPLAFLSAAYPAGHVERADAGNMVGTTVYELVELVEPPWHARAALLERIQGMVTGHAKQTEVKEELDTARGHEYVAMVTDLTQQILGDGQPLAATCDRLTAEVAPILARITRMLGEAHWSYQTASGVLRKALLIAASPSEVVDKDHSVLAERMIPVATFGPAVHSAKVHYKQQNASSALASAVTAEFDNLAGEPFPVVMLTGLRALGRFPLASAVGWYLRTMQFEGELVGGEEDLVVEANVEAKMGEVFGLARQRARPSYLILIGESRGPTGDIMVTAGPDCSRFQIAYDKMEAGSVYIVGSVSDADAAQPADACDEILAMATVVAEAILKFHRDYDRT